MADKAAQSLLQRENRERHLILVERLAAVRADGIDSRRGDWIRRRGERQLVDDHTAQRLADDVDTLPEARCREQHGMRRLAKQSQELGPRRRSLNQDWIVECQFGDPLYGAKRGVTGEQHERAAAGTLENLDDLAACSPGKIG